MADDSEPTIQQQTSDSLIRVQEFDVSQLPRENILGTSLNFRDAIPPAERLISLYRRLSTTALEDFPDDILNRIRNQCNADYQKFQQILEFDPSSQQTPSTVRDQYIQQLADAYDPAYNTLSPHISYSLHRSADFQRLDADARSTLQGIKDEAATIQTELAAQKTDAEEILNDVREIAAEQGVTQQAIYFQQESAGHDTNADKWEKRTIQIAGALALFAVASIFLHKWEWIAPQNTFEIVQLVTSKILIFAVLTYMLVLSAKNYLNHKHNSIVNKHRQNALMTYKAMVDATDDPGSREAILIQAASCIYNPQSTGYAPGSDTPAVSGKSMVEILSKPAVQAASNVAKP